MSPTVVVDFRMFVPHLFKILLASSRLMFTPMLRKECWISAAST